MGETKQTALRLAVLGDSDSHSYGDTIWFPADSSLRGGAYRATTLQWTEVLARLRSDEIDQGQWGSWGKPGRLAKVLSLVGLDVRTPRKQDFEFNFAWSGATCENLHLGISGQAPQLLRLIERDPAAWQGGLVQIRIGINNLGVRDFLDKAAELGLAGVVAEKVERCVDDISKALRLIRRQQPDLKIVLVGILNNSDWPPYFEYWQSAGEQANIDATLDGFDQAMMKLAEFDANVEFFDDRKWFRSYWGGRGVDGMPDYRVYSVANGIAVSNTQGDSPEHAIIEDGHGGTRQNAIWARDFILFLNEKWKIGLTPIRAEELVQLGGRAQ